MLQFSHLWSGDVGDNTDHVVLSRGVLELPCKVLRTGPVMVGGGCSARSDCCTYGTWQFQDDEKES